MTFQTVYVHCEDNFVSDSQDGYIGVGSQRMVDRLRKVGHHPPHPPENICPPSTKHFALPTHSFGQYPPQLCASLSS